MYQLPYLDQEERTSVSAKCNSTECQTEEGKPTITEQDFVKVIPVQTEGEINPIELLEKAKRLIICTQCGNLRLTN